MALTSFPFHSLPVYGCPAKCGGNVGPISLRGGAVQPNRLKTPKSGPADLKVVEAE